MNEMVESTIRQWHYPVEDLFTTGSDGRAKLKETETNKETTTDSEENIARGAIKYDAGKPAVFRGLIDYFPRAVEQVASVSTFGASKYAWKGWEGVDDGINRYSDAMARHLLEEAKGKPFDSDSGLLHAAHVAWGALARLELMLRERDAENNS